MNRHVGLRVGGIWRRSVADLQTASPGHPPLVLRGINYSSSTPLQAKASFPMIRPTLSRTLSTSNTAALILRNSRSLPRHSRNPPFRATESRIISLATPGWNRCAHSKSKGKRSSGERRNKSSVSNGSQKPAPVGRSAPKAELSPNAPYDGKASGRRKDASSTSSEKSAAPLQPLSNSGHGSSNKSLLNRLPDLSHLHRPTKEELLAAATGFWSRLRVHFKWFSIKSSRPFNIDDISAFFSWILVGHVMWIILGTTTFFSLIIWFVNTVFAQETLAQWIGNYLTQSSGIKVVFESAVVPKWKDGVISFKNVFVSRRPGQGRSNVSKGERPASTTSGQATADRASQSDPEGEDTNYTQFDVTIDTVNVTLSFAKWFNGKGLLGDVEVRGIRGVIDRTCVLPTTEYVDPRIYKHQHTPGDFELDSFKMEDVLVTVYQPGGFRPFSVSIYTCDLPQLRKQFLFYDFLSAKGMSGSFDNSLFTIHPRQSHNYTGSQLVENTQDGGVPQWKKQSRLRIDALNIDHLNRGVEGPFGWIREGNVDIVADIMIPTDEDGSLAKVMADFYDRMEATVTSENFLQGSRQRTSQDKNGDQDAKHEELAKPVEKEEENRFVVMDLRVHFNDVRAAVPLFTRDISYVNNALIRPIVAYINSKRAFIPVSCRVVKRYSEFDGSWTLYDSGLLEDLSREMYEAFARDVLDDHHSRNRRLKKVGFWTLQLAAQALFIGMAGNIA